MILAILQARVSSTRLPGKVLMPLLGEPMICRQIQRIQRSKRIDRLILATSSDPSDDPLVQLCLEKGVECFRGSLQDVLDRFYQAARSVRPDHVVRLTGDCPLTEPDLIDAVIDYHLEQGLDYTTNALEPTYPDGLDVEVVRYPCLEEAWLEAVAPSQREHVTPFIHQQPQRFHIGHYKQNTDCSHLRWTVDEQADYELVCSIYEALSPSDPSFGYAEIIRLLEERPELLHYNTRFQRNEGYHKSLKEDVKLNS